MIAADDDAGDGLLWTTSNFAEVVPGVQTPLSVSIWAPSVDRATRQMMFRIGVITAAERDGALPYPLQSPILRTFYGRAAVQVAIFTVIGDRIPGATGEGAVVSMLGRKPENLHLRPTRRRYPFVAVRVPYLAVTMPALIRRTNDDSRQWYDGACARLATLSYPAAIALLDEARSRFERSVALQAMTTLAVVQPLYEGVERLIAATGVGDAGVFSGSGSPEVAGLIGSIWKASRGGLSVDDVRRAYGFHGPAEGELSSRSWREDPDPVARLMEHYAAMGEQDDPATAESAHRARRATMTAELLRALPASRRPAARATLALAARRIPLRGAAKESFLRAFDVARGAARRVGEHLAGQGVIDHADDIFFLTADELRPPAPADARTLVAERRARREHWQSYSLPSHWSGRPPEIRQTAEADSGTTITGVGVSAGVAVGVARVLATPDFAEIEPGEILVAPFTDPGWASVMFMSAALVVDIGGALSHAAVVARELRLPCVVNTQTGTRAIHTGDEIRVDGSNGVVEILKRGV
jgi:phosphohistidine swiveling domain-containing protein